MVTSSIVQYFEKQVESAKAASSDDEREKLFREVWRRVAQASAVVPGASTAFQIIDHNRGTQSERLKDLPRFTKSDPATEDAAWKVYVT